MKIPVFEPTLGKLETRFVRDALNKKAISGLVGGYVDKFEDGFARYCGCRYGVATNSGTTALHLALAALRIKKGDEVLVSTFTNMATFFSVLYQGASPIPIDIEPDTWNMDPGLIEDKITGRTRAILAVHIYGHPCDMDPIRKIARKHNLFIIEDCAEAHGAKYRGKMAGSLGDIGCFSFYSNKIITTGEGGMITLNDKRLAERARSLKSLAFGRKNKFMHQDIGFGYRLGNLQAALGYAQLKKIEATIIKKRRVALVYQKNLQEIPGLQLPVQRPYARNVYWMYHVVARKGFGLSRDKLMRKLSGDGIETRESFIPYNMQRIFINRGWVKRNACPVANYVGQNGFYLPSSPNLTLRELSYIVERIRNHAKKI